MFNTTAQILTPSEVAALAPAVFAPAASPTRTERYGFVSTASILDTLALDGWQPTYVGLKKSRTLEKKLFGSHTLRLRHVDAPTSGEYVPEIVLRNGHDGSSAVKIDFGVFRTVCANGLVIQSNNFSGFKLFHSQYAADKVRAGVDRMMHDVTRIDGTIDAMRSKNLNYHEQVAFAERAAVLRWGAPELVPVVGAALVVPMRREDRGQDVWTTFNVVQEHLLRGGDRGRAVTGRRLTTREVTAVDASHKLNADLWALAEEFAGLRPVDAAHKLNERLGALAEAFAGLRPVDTTVGAQ